MIYGLFIEGCKFDYSARQLAESDMKVLYTKSPIIGLLPVETLKLKEYSHYKCPVYKTAERKGVLSTTGHSTNFIIYINMPTTLQENHWVKRGVAMLCQLS
jgi:dynein heavy chain